MNQNSGADSDSNDLLGSGLLAQANGDDGDYKSSSGLLTTVNTGGGLQSDDEELPHLLREQDRFLPIANVAKLMKKAIPERGKIAKDAKECVQECVSEFISFITSEAAERCSQERRKTINGEDILFAMSTLGFDNYVEPLKIFLHKYRESIKCDTSRINTTDSNQQQQHHQQQQQQYTNQSNDHILSADQLQQHLIGTDSMQQQQQHHLY